MQNNLFDTLLSGTFKSIAICVPNQLPQKIVHLNMLLKSTKIIIIRFLYIIAEERNFKC